MSEDVNPYAPHIQVWPVIHVDSREQVARNVVIAKRAGCAGAMLIHMKGLDDTMDEHARSLLGNGAKFKIGVNYLSLPPLQALERSIHLGYDATWTDHQMFTRGEISHMARGVVYTLRATVPMGMSHPLFAAVAFKGQEEDPFPGDSAGLAAHYGLIPTTSGAATGMPPSTGKIERLRAGINDHGIVTVADQRPLAIASGVTPDNIRDFMHAGATHFLVATGISESFHELDEAKLAALMMAARS